MRPRWSGLRSARRQRNDTRVPRVRVAREAGRAYTRNMKSWLRVLLVVCLSIVLPLQALAGAAMLDCGGAVSGIEAASHDHAAHDAGAHPSQQSVHGDHASHDSPSSPGDDPPARDCAQCGVCHLACTGGLTPFVASWQPAPVADVLVPVLHASRPDAPAHRLLRPPRPALM